MEKERSPVAFSIQRLVESDLDEVVAVDALSRLTPWSRPSFSEELRNPFSHGFTIRDGKASPDPLLGFLCFRLVGEESEILALAVHPNHRRRGFARQLMTFYLDFCSQRDVKVYSLETGVTNEAAVRLYESFSYRGVGVRPKYYAGKEGALLMVRRA